MLGSLGFNWWTKPKAADAQRGPGSAFHLWIDGVGGYLVCPGNHLTLGQATPHTAVDVPLQADVSRLHATLTRDAEGYMLRAVKPTRVNEKAVAQAILRDGDLLTLGAACQIRFRQPVPVSASARLELASAHRLRLSVDGVLLMAEALVLGPGEQAHVPIPELTAPVVLFRQSNALCVRAPKGATVNGRAINDRSPVKPGDHVEGEGFSFSLEAA